MCPSWLPGEPLWKSKDIREAGGMREVEVGIVWRGIKLEGLQVVVVAGNTGARLSVWDPYQWGY